LIDHRLWPYTARGARERLALAGAVGFGLLAGLFAVGQAMGLSRSIDLVFLGGADREAAAGWLSLLALAALARAAAVAAGEACAQELSIRTRAELRGRLAHHLVALGPHRVAGERAGELVRTATAGVDALDATLSQYLPQALLAALVPLAILVAVFAADPLSALVLFVTLPLVPLFTALVGSLAAARTAEQWRTLGRLSARLLDGLHGLPTLVALGRAEDHAAEVGRTAERLRVAAMRVLRVAFLSGFVLELLATIGTALVAVQVGLRLLHGHVEFASALFVLLLAPEFYKPLRALGASFHAAMPGRDAAARIFALLETAAPDASGGRVAPADGGAPGVAFESVSFAYAAGRPALDAATFVLPAGRVTALAGPSGAGKSTAAALLLRFLEPAAGRIAVDGATLADLEAEAWRRRIAWVPQRPHLFAGSVRDNLLLARPGATTAELQRAAAVARFDEVLAELPRGWDTPLGEAGARLSSGQAQRLALARAFLRDAPLLVLDEPTAHLDPGLQARLSEATRELCRGRTALVIAHRLETLASADHVVVLAGGRVVEQGAPRDLRAAGGRFAALWGTA
jgi:ATP-binding cassette subfamily C protein CydD